MNKNNKKLNISAKSRCAVIVAHPDDETLWMGGTLLMHPEAKWSIVTLCRGSDSDRAGKFQHVCQRYNAQGWMGDLDDGPEQIPLSNQLVQETLLNLLPSRRFDLIFTHALAGEYTRHRRHEEVSEALFNLCRTDRLYTQQLICFAYDDAKGTQLPQPDEEADIKICLGHALWQKKQDIITGLYGFSPDSWEARVTPKQEAFWTFSPCPSNTIKSQTRRIKNEGIGVI